MLARLRLWGNTSTLLKATGTRRDGKIVKKSEKPVEFGGAPGCGPPSSTGSLASPADMSASSSTVGTRLRCTPAEPAAPELSAMPAPRCFWTAPTSEFFFKGKCYQAVLRARMLRVSPRVVPLWLGRGAQVARRAREPACTQQTRRGGRILPPCTGTPYDSHEFTPFTANALAAQGHGIASF